MYINNERRTLGETRSSDQLNGCAACKTEQHNGGQPSLPDPGGHHRNVSLSAFTPAARYKHTLIKAARKKRSL